jgi:hypothetical protein
MRTYFLGFVEINCSKIVAILKICPLRRWYCLKEESLALDCCLPEVRKLSQGFSVDIFPRFTTKLPPPSNRLQLKAEVSEQPLEWDALPKCTEKHNAFLSAGDITVLSARGL